MTAYGMLRWSAFPVTDRAWSILIGSVAGGFGTAVAQLAQMLYPKLTIFGTCSPSKFDFARSIGVIPIDRNTPPERLAQTVRELNDGEGVDIAYKATASERNMKAFLDATQADGQTHCHRVHGRDQGR